MDKIKEFQGPYAFLSNFYGCPVKHEGILYASSEAAFQAAKCLDPADRMPFTKARPGESKRMGRKVNLRPDWDHVRIGIMHDIVLDKFTRTPYLTRKLLETGDAELIEGNTWHDTFWGIDLHTEKGENHLGKILMEVRDEIRKKA